MRAPMISSLIRSFRASKLFSTSPIILATFINLGLSAAKIAESISASVIEFGSDTSSQRNMLLMNEGLSGGLSPGCSA
jgi:hypothetical protein